MKNEIHPNTKDITITCSCGEIFKVNAALAGDEKVEICSKCHPYYTGEQRILKTGAVDKFYARMEKAKKLKK